jgi:hypothetical protein
MAELDPAALVLIDAEGVNTMDNPSSPHPMSCPRCDRELQYVGTKKFHEGSRGWGFWLGDLGELFTHREHFDVYVCPRCGRVELFVDGIGEEFRPH